MLHLDYLKDIKTIYFIIIYLIIGTIINIIIDLIDFKIFAKKHFYIDINIFLFLKELILSKIKRHN